MQKKDLPFPFAMDKVRMELFRLPSTPAVGLNNRFDCIFV